MFNFLKGFLRSILTSFGQVILILALALGVILLGQQWLGGVFDDIGQGVRSGLEGFANLFPSNEPDTRGIVLPDVEPIQALSALTATRFNYAGIVTSTTGMPSLLQTLYGDNLVMVAVVRIEAGVDLSAITPDNLTYDEATATLNVSLPPAILQNCFLNENESHVVSRNTGIFARNAPELDISARRFALRQFRDTALEEDILGTAQSRAEELVGNFIRLFVPEDVAVAVTSEPAPNPPVLVDTCQ